MIASALERASCAFALFNTISTIFAAGKSDGASPYFQRPGDARQRMRVRIIKNPRAPLMDGFNVGGMGVEHTYDVAHRMGRYLIIAGYAGAPRTNQSS